MKTYTILIFLHSINTKPANNHSIESIKCDTLHRFKKINKADECLITFQFHELGNHLGKNLLNPSSLLFYISLITVLFDNQSLSAIL